MTTYTDPDTSVIRAHRGAGSTPRISDTAGQVSGTSGKVAGVTDGKGPEQFTGDAATIGQALAGLATDAAISTEVWGDLNKAVDDWDANAPKAEVMNAAEKAVTDAQAACTAANAAADAAPDDKELAKKADDAGEALIKAKQHLIDLQRKRKAAVKALLEAIGRAITKAKRITGAAIPGKDSDTGRSTPGTGTGTGAGTGTQSASTPAAKPGSGAPATPKPTGTPAATPASAPTSTSSSKGSGLDSSDVAAIAALAGQNQNGQQQPQAQQAAQSMPTMPTVGQPTAQQQDGKGKGTAEEKPLGDKLAEAALGGSPSALLSSFSSTPSATPTPTPAPAAQPTTQFRGPDAKITGVNLGGTPAVNTQNPVTSGSSATNLHTASDISGRSEPARTAFSQPSPGGPATTTSGAHGTETGQQGQGTQQRQTGTGTPFIPPAGAVGGAPTGSGGRQGDGEANRIIGRGPNGERLLGDQEAVSEAVPGGTIAQNKPDRAA